MKLTRDDVLKVYEELDRRIEFDIYDGTIADKATKETPYSQKLIEAEYETRLQGVYGTLMALTEDGGNWPDVAYWCREIEYERYWWIKKRVDQENAETAELEGNY